MKNNPDWLKTKEKPYFLPISLDCVKKLVECMESIDIEEMNCDTYLKTQEILSNDIYNSELLEFAIENFDELISYIN